MSNHLETINNQQSVSRFSGSKELIIKWIESITISILFPVIGHYIDSSDPFFINHEFPWLIFAPLLICLRYGFVYGIMSASLLIGLVAITFYLGWPQVPFFPTEMVIGLLLVTMISAEFHDIWFRKIRLIENKYNHIKLRMDEFSHVYHLLKGSHNRLEQHVVNQAGSLRLSLLDLEQKILSLEKNEGMPLEGVSEHILKLFADYGNFQIAAIYAVNNQKKIKNIDIKPVACLGHPFPLWSLDPLVKEALSTGCVASVKMEDDHAMIAGGALVVIPLMDTYQKIWGIVAVSEMPLFSLHENNLDLFAVLGGRIGDLIKRRDESSCNINGNSDDFKRRLYRVFEDIKQLKVSAVVIASTISNKEQENKFLARVQADFRGLDKFWIFKNDQNNQVILKLLPLTDESGAIEFLNRFGLSKLTTERVYHGSDRKAFSCCDEDISIYTWILDHKVIPEKVLLGVNQVVKVGFADSKIAGGGNENITGAA